MGRRVNLMVLLASIYGCSEAKFTGLLFNDSRENAVGSVDPSCRFVRAPHPDVDAMVFDIWVPGPEVTLNVAGFERAEPVNRGDGFVFLGVTLPVGSDGKVSVSVQSAAKTAECSMIVTPVRLSAGSLKTISTDSRGGTMEFAWTVAGLYKGESLYFQRQDSVFSPDLRLDCDSGAASLKCRVSFLKREDSLSLRYKDQRFAWSIRDDGIPERNFFHPLDMNLILDDPAAPATEPVLDPDNCRPFTSRATGLQISHVCTGAQSLFGGLATGPAACRFVPSDFCKPPP